MDTLIAEPHARKPVTTAVCAWLARATDEAWHCFDRWHARTSRRRRLTHLSPRLLKDIGVTPEATRARAPRTFWVL